MRNGPTLSLGAYTGGLPQFVPLYSNSHSICSYRYYGVHLITQISKYVLFVCYLHRWAFFLSGGIQIVYDLLLLWSFSGLRAEHEQKL